MYCTLTFFSSLILTYSLAILSQQVRLHNSLSIPMEPQANHGRGKLSAQSMSVCAVPACTSQLPSTDIQIKWAKNEVITKSCCLCRHNGCLCDNPRFQKKESGNMVPSVEIDIVHTHVCVCVYIYIYIQQNYVCESTGSLLHHLLLLLLPILLLLLLTSPSPSCPPERCSSGSRCAAGDRRARCSWRS